MTSADPTTAEDARRIARAITWVRLPVYAFGLWLVCDCLSAWLPDWQGFALLLLAAMVLALETLALHFPDRDDAYLRRIAFALVLVIDPLLPLVMAARLWFDPPPPTDSLIVGGLGGDAMLKGVEPLDWLLAAGCAVVASALVPARALRRLLPLWVPITFVLFLLLVVLLALIDAFTG
ncbi:MAG: hypothetical protein WAT39_04280 [Planctomycetota bacterium]